MLVLSRKPNEAVCVGQNITITVLGVRGGTIKLGIDAPPNVRILRGELSSFDAETPNDSPKPRKRRRIRETVGALDVA